jgi:hypothetical protein
MLRNPAGFSKELTCVRLLTIYLVFSLTKDWAVEVETNGGKNLQPLT